MASRASNKLVRSLKGRMYTTQAAAQTDSKAPSLPPQGAKFTQLPNGILVASIENYSPVSRIAAVTLAGSRFETPHNVGITHCLRALSGLSTQGVSNYGLIRSVQQIGGNFSCTSSREYIQYNIQCQRDNVQDALDPLVDILTRPAFKPWEVQDAQPQMKVDLAVLEAQPESYVLDLLHEAAFRDTLGRSLYTPEINIGRYKPEQLMSYVQNTYTAGRVAFVGVGVDHELLTQKLMRVKTLEGSNVPTNKAVYHGGERRVARINNLTYVAVAAEGPSLNSKEVLAAGILQMVLGSGPYVKYSSNVLGSKLAQAVSKVTSQPFAISGLNVSYSDSGLFGFLAVSQSDDTDKVLNAAFQQMAAITKTGLSDKEVQRGKNQLKSSACMYLEDGTNLMNDLAAQAMLYGKFVSAEELVSSIDAITTSDVNNVAKKIINGKQSMAAVGDLSNTPYLDQLGK